MKFTLELEQATDTPETTWAAHCLELDVVTQGRTPAEAVTSIAKAIDMTLRAEIEALESSGQIENPGWERAYTNIAEETASRQARPETAFPQAFDTYDADAVQLALKRPYSGKLP